MGGHGGLNILPQKRWHLYRDDNRERVLRDERLDRERREEEARQARNEAADERLDELRGRRILGNDFVNDSEPSRLETFERETRERQNSATSSSANRVNNTNQVKKSGHFNLFEEEERAESKLRMKHDKYLESIGHELKSISDFDAAKKSSENPWYLRSKEQDVKDKVTDEFQGTADSLNSQEATEYKPSKKSSDDASSHKRQIERKAKVMNADAYYYMKESKRYLKKSKHLAKKAEKAWKRAKSFKKKLLVMKRVSKKASRNDDKSESGGSNETSNDSEGGQSS